MIKPGRNIMDTHAQTSASERGSVDAYYGRRPEPHYYVGYAYLSLIHISEPTRPY